MGNNVIYYYSIGTVISQQSNNKTEDTKLEDYQFFELHGEYIVIIIILVGEIINQ